MKFLYDLSLHFARTCCYHHLHAAHCRVSNRVSNGDSNYAPLSQLAAAKYPTNRRQRICMRSRGRLPLFRCPPGQRAHLRPHAARPFAPPTLPLPSRRLWLVRPGPASQPASLVIAWIARPVVRRLLRRLPDASCSRMRPVPRREMRARAPWPPRPRSVRWRR